MPLKWLASTSVKNNTLVIIGYSGRAIAQIARRSGYERIFVLDLFADVDTELNASQAITIADSQAVDIDPKLARKRMRALCEQVPVADTVFASGLEKHHALMNDVSSGWVWLNCSSKTISQVRDFHWLCLQLDRLQIPYPETCWTLPSKNQSDWLGKMNFSSGGNGIAPFWKNKRWARADYWQRVKEGQTISISVCAWPDQSSELIGFSRQLMPSSRSRYNRFRFEGLISGIQLTNEIKTKLLGYVEQLVKFFNFEGWFGVDFLVSDEEILLLEINPRPTAALELFDQLRLNDSPWLHHVCACKQVRPDRQWQVRPNWLAGLRVVYATQPVVIDNAIDWPEWVRDIPHSGCRIPVNAPICSVLAEHEEEHELEQLLAFRAKKLEHLFK